MDCCYLFTFAVRNFQSAFLQKLFHYLASTTKMQLALAVSGCLQPDQTSIPRCSSYSWTNASLQTYRISAYITHDGIGCLALFSLSAFIHTSRLSMQAPGNELCVRLFAPPKRETRTASLYLV